MKKKLIHACPVCSFIRRITEANEGTGIESPLIHSGAMVKYIDPKKCKNALCQKFQTDRASNPTAFLIPGEIPPREITYAEWKVANKYTEDQRLKFLIVGVPESTGDKADSKTVVG